MKKLIILLLLFLALTISCKTNNSCQCGNNDEPIEQIDDDKKGINYVNIFSINDTHGAALSEDSVIGLDKVKSVIDTIETLDGEYIKIANGDIFQGGYLSNRTEGRVFIDLLNELEFDCFVIGNHEFDWGLDTIAKYKDGDDSNGELNCQFLGCNIIDKRTNSIPSWINEYTIVENKGFKVGIIGCIGSSLKSSISEDKTVNYDFINPDNRIKELSKELRVDKDCDVVIVSIHEYNITHNEVISNFSGDERIDAIICGHTHQKIEDYEVRDSYQVPIIQNYTKNGTVGTIKLTMVDGELTSSTIKHYSPANFPINSSIASIKDKYQEYIIDGEETIFYNNTYLSKDALGLIIADAIKDGTSCDFGIANVGGVRTTFFVGEVRYKDIIELYPFDNQVYIVTMTGKDLAKLINDNEEYLYVSGNIEVKDIVKTNKYKLAIVNYIFNKDSYSYYFKSYAYEDTNTLVRDMLIDYLRK